MTPGVLVLTFVTAERLFELWFARKNTARLLQSGAREFAPGHYPLIVGLHTLWLAGLWLVAWSSSINSRWLLVFAALQLLRLWVLVTLGKRWTTRIIVLPDAPLVREGPYRFLSHPNYIVVVAEMAVLPLVFNLLWFALLFSVLNGIVLTIRIRAENRALSRFRWHEIEAAQSMHLRQDGAMPQMSNDAAEEASTAANWVGFGMMCIGMFMAILDVQVVATSLPTIQSALDIPPDQMSWVQTAYLIAEVIAIPLTGALTRVLSMRWLFVLALTVFTLASIGCAASISFSVLICWRVVQGFSGGTLIPAVFTAVFVLFPIRHQGIATTLAGVLAVLAPTVGPIVGGWITESYSWHWLFLINVLPGLIAVLFAAVLLPRVSLRMNELLGLDFVSLSLMAISLAALEIALKEAPETGWSSGFILSLLALSIACAVGFVVRTLGTYRPVVDLRNFADRNFTIGCILSFVLGIGLFGSVYLMPVFLAFVRDHNALEIGTIMLVTGMTQLVTAPIAVALEQRVGARLLTAAGFGVFAIGLGMSSLQTPQTDYQGMFWAQIVRGLAIMFCLLPPTRLALGRLSPAHVPDASGLFNLMRNLGGAIGIALIDTVIYVRSPVHGDEIMAKLQAGDMATATFVGVPLNQFSTLSTSQFDATTNALLQPLVDKAALAQAINEAWMMIALLTAAALFCVPFARRAIPSI